MTLITCVNRRFTADAERTQDVMIEINGVGESQVSITLIEQAEVSVEIVPNSASPVLKSELTVYLDPNYPNTLVREDFEAILFSNDDLEFERPLYVMSVDDEEKSLKIKFPGAVSGSYWIQLSAIQHGRIDSDLL